jgi:hypothetical protein
VETKLPTHNEATRLLLGMLRHPASRIKQVLLNPVTDNAITIGMNETVDAEVRVYEYDDGVVMYEAIGWVDDVNGIEQVTTICATLDIKEARDKVVEFYHRFM